MKQSSTAKPGRRSSSKAAASPSSATATILDNGAIAHEEIARLAHSYWEARGGDGGSPEEDWLRAEQELKARRAAAAE
jgi:hypothetical protein